MDITRNVSVPTRRSFVQKYPLAAFFLLAFGFTWPFLIVDALGSYGLIPFRLPASGPGFLLVLLMAYGPTLAAFIVTGLISGKAGMRKLFGRLLRWRVGLHWYLITIFGLGIFFFIAWQITILLGGTAKDLPPGGLPALALNGLIMFLVNSVINGEEFGWRGFALPRLQAKYSALASSLILGVFWALFHLPLFFTKGGGIGGNMSNTPILAFVLNVIAGSILITWVFNNTRGSVLMAYIFHAATNTWSVLFASDAAGGLIFWVQLALSSLVAVILVLAYGPARLSRHPKEEQQFVIEA